MSEFAFEPAVEEHNSHDHQHENGHGQAETLALSVDDFSALEERILRAVELVKRERSGRIAAEERATQAEARLQDQEPVTENLQKEVNALRVERDQVRQRVERLLAQLDALEL
jgi:uncharacterized coiled-coil protein SlyX